MTKEQYLEQLKNNLNSLTIEEQNEAIQYYSDYFEESGFDEEKILQDFGTPEQLAESVKKDLSNAVATTNKSNYSESDCYNSVNDGLYYEFDKEKIKSVEFSFAAAEVICIPGNKFSIETRGVLKENLICRLEKDVLRVKNINKFENFRFFTHSRHSRYFPRILITIPNGLAVDTFNVSIGAGRFETKDLSFSCKGGKIDAGTGNFVLKGLSGHGMNIRCGMGNLELSGNLTGRTNIDCGMGAIKLILSGKEEDYSFDSKVGLGSVDVNDNKKDGINQYCSDSIKENHFSINCGLGSVKVKLR